MLRSVDLQQIFSNTSSLEKVQSVNQRHPDMEHRHFVLQLHEEDKQNKEEIKKSQETKQTEIRDEDKNKGRGREKKVLKAIDGEGMTTEMVEKPPEIDQGKIVDIII
ncbi:MAG: hypothetical protein ABID54_05835 [Pseudomonadota bacterium]